MIPHNKWWIIRLVYSIDLLIGLGLLIYSVLAVREALSARDWPTVRGVVAFAGMVERSSGDNDPVYAADIRYDYTVGNQRYLGTRVGFGDLSSANSSAAEAVLQRYIPGQQIPVYYDPDHPENAVLEPGFAPEIWLPIGVGAFFLLSGTVMAVWWFFYVRRHAEQPKPYVEVL